MVIYSHLEYCDNSVMKYFSPIFLTTFFFVSGYLFKEGKSFWFVLENRTRTLLLPFLALGGVMIAMSQILTFNERVSLADSIKGLLFQNGENQILWFVGALYVYSLVFYWVERLCKSTNQLFMAGLLLFVANTAYSHWLALPSIPWHVCYAGYACFYMALGKLYKSHEQRIDGLISNRWLPIIALAYIAVIYFGDFHITFLGSRYLVDALFVTVIGLILCVLVSKRFLNNSRFLLFVGANTLFYFAFHGKVYSLLQSLAGKTALYSDAENLFYRLAIAAVIVLADALILILPAMFVNKFVPQILGRGFRLWKVK